MRNLFILSGLPSSGKSTLGRELADKHCFAADDFFYDSWGYYHFDPSKLGNAHDDCKNMVINAMEESVSKIAVANTFTTKKEIQPYIDLCNKYYYIPVLIKMCNDFGTNIHNVPEDTISKMRGRFQDLEVKKDSSGKYFLENRLSA